MSFLIEDAHIDLIILFIQPIWWKLSAHQTLSAHTHEAASASFFSAKYTELNLTGVVDFGSCFGGSDNSNDSVTSNYLVNMQN